MASQRPKLVARCPQCRQEVEPVQLRCRTCSTGRPPAGWPVAAEVPKVVDRDGEDPHTEELPFEDDAGNQTMPVAMFLEDALAGEFDDAAPTRVVAAPASPTLSPAEFGLDDEVQTIVAAKPELTPKSAKAARPAAVPAIHVPRSSAPTPPAMVRVGQPTPIPPRHATPAVAAASRIALPGPSRIPLNPLPLGPIGSPEAEPDEPDEAIVEAPPAPRFVSPPPRIEARPIPSTVRPEPTPAPSPVRPPSMSAPTPVAEPVDMPSVDIAPRSNMGFYILVWMASFLLMAMVSLLLVNFLEQPPAPIEPSTLPVQVSGIPVRQPPERAPEQVLPPEPVQAVVALPPPPVVVAAPPPVVAPPPAPAPPPRTTARAPRSTPAPAPEPVVVVSPALAQPVVASATPEPAPSPQPAAPQADAKVLLSATYVGRYVSAPASLTLKLLEGGAVTGELMVHDAGLTTKRALAGNHAKGADGVWTFAVVEQGTAIPGVLSGTIDDGTAQGKVTEQGRVKGRFYVRR